MGLERHAIEGLDPQLDSRIRIRADRDSALMVVARRDLAGAFLEPKPVLADGLLAADDDLEGAVGSDLHLIVRERGDRAARRMALRAPALDREGGEGRGADIARHPIATVVADGCKVVERVGIAAEELPGRCDILLEDRPLRLRLEPEEERRLEQMSDRARTLGRFIGIRDAHLGSEIAGLHTANRIEQPQQRIARRRSGPIRPLRRSHLGRPRDAAREIRRHRRQTAGHTAGHAHALHEIPSVHRTSLSLREY
jgi:hypothetical protein